MPDPSEIPSSLVSLIYSAAADASKWVDVCEGLNRHAGLGILMFGHCIDANRSLGMIGGGFDPVELERYHAHFADKNPWMHMDLALPVGAVGVSDRALSQRDLFKTEFYNDWLRHQENVIGGPALMCHRAGDKFVAMAAACRAPRYETMLLRAQCLLETLAPHITRAIEMSGAFQGSGTDFDHLHDSRHGIILIRRSGRVALVNGVAEEALVGLRLGRITPTQKLVATDATLQDYFEAALAAIQASRHDALPRPLIIAAEPFPCVVHAHILPNNLESSFPGSVWSDPVAGAFVIAGPGGLHASEDVIDLAKSFGATPAEAALAQSLMEGSTLYDYADRHSLSRHTVRNQMRSLLHKTGARNQTEFVNRMHALSSPFQSVRPSNGA